MSDAKKARFRVSGDLLVAFVINDMEADSLDAAVKLVEEGDEEVRALMSTDSVEDAVVEVHDSEEINERGECISEPTGLPPGSDDEEESDAAFLNDLAEKLFHAPLNQYGIDQYHSDRLRGIACKLDGSDNK